MQWRKMGRIFTPRTDLWWNRSHAMVPIPDHREGGLYRIYFCGRDEHNRSQVGWVLLDINDPGRILDVSSDPALSPGELGCFDDCGVTPSWLVDREGLKYLYYIGWKSRSSTRMSLVAGLAVSRDGGDTFERISRAPVLSLTDTEPFSILTAPCVHPVPGGWRMWYVSCVGWLHADLPRYHIKCAESGDGVHWRQEGRVCIDFASPEETALARPCVLPGADKWRMWYSYKTEAIPYRIGYAESPDGLHWERMDQRAGIGPSATGWDSEMVEYAYVFTHQGETYMLYNGNGYGTEGFGLAVLDG